MPEDNDATCLDYWYIVADKPDAPKCKHGKHECPICGQRKTDTPHTTVGGKGKIARILSGT